MGINNGNSDEKPIHTVTVDDFYIGKYEVTFEEYDKFCEATGRNKPNDRGWGRGRIPVINVSWNDAVSYCNWLSEHEGLDKFYNINGDELKMNWNANGYRLPTEAEWEYAARGGNKSHGYKYSGSNNIDKVAWYKDNSRGKTHEVSTKHPNELGIYDMSGNVWEWCNDLYYSGYYYQSPRNNPKKPNSSSRRVVRGGSWRNVPDYCRVSGRYYDYPANSGSSLGFRIARTVK